MQELLTLRIPAPISAISQRFGANANNSYSADGLKGHTAIDWEASWDSPGINCADNAYVYSTMNKDNPDPDKYRSVFTLVETRAGIYEISYGHCNQILAEIGHIYKAGEVLYTAGNTGPVFAGGMAVTKAMKLTGNRSGTHLHAPQVRPVRRVKKTDKTKQYLSDGHGIFRKDGDYFEILDYGNGYHGCIDPAQFFNVKSSGTELPFEDALTLLRSSHKGTSQELLYKESVLRKHYGR